MCRKNLIKNIGILNPKLNRKSYFFLLDGIFAIVILMIGFIIILSQKPVLESDTTLILTSENVMDLMSSIKINQLCNACQCSNQKLQEFCNQGLIKNQDQTFMDFLGELYFRNNKPKANELFIDFSNKLIRQDLFGIELIINNEVISYDVEIEKSKKIISNKKLIFGFFESPDSGQVEFWGPYILEVNLWEK